MLSSARILFVIMVCAQLAAGDARAQGYDGLIAPEETPKTGAVKSGTANDQPVYQGLIAPADKSPGYQGLIDGDTDYAGKMTPGSAAPKLTADPNVPQMPTRPRNAEDLRNMSMIHGFDRNGDGIPDGIISDISKRAAPTQDQIDAMNTPRPRTGGMLSGERMIYNSIAATLVDVKTSKGATRTEKAKRSLEQLRTMRTGIASKANIPSSIYKAMGVTDLYIKEERESLKNSLARIDAAIEELEKF